MTIPFQYNFAGKFTAPNAEWMHLTRQLCDFELFIVTEGVLYIAGDDKEYVLQKGQFLLMSPSVRQHGYQSSNCSFYWLHFAVPDSYEVIDSKAYAYDPDFIALPEYGSLQSYERMVILMKQLQDSERRYGLPCLNNFNTSVILGELSAQCFSRQRYRNADNSSQLYNDIADYITLNSCGNLKVSDIADYFGYNEKYLTTYFKKWAKISIKQYILQTRMEYAKAELSETNHSVAQIACNIGYTDPHNFSNAFKKVVGLTPSEFRDSYSKRRIYQQ